MFCPVGYISINEIENQIKKMSIVGYSDTVFHDHLERVGELFVTSPDGDVTRISDEILTLCFGEYLFIDRRGWAVSLEQFRKDIGEFKSSSPDLDENDLEVALYIMRKGLSKHVDATFVKAMLKFESFPICLNEAGQKKLIQRAKAFPALRVASAPAHRPRKMEKAMQLIASEWPDSKLPSWKEVINVLEAKHGFKVGKTTLIAAAKKVTAAKEATAKKAVPKKAAAKKKQRRKNHPKSVHKPLQ